MNDNNEFSINPDKYPSRTQRVAKARRPLPPGQTRHVYAGREDDIPFMDDDPEEVAEADVQADEQPKRRTTKRRRGRPDNVEPAPRLVSFFMDRRMSVAVGVTCIILSCIVFIVLLSQIGYGALDQAVVNNLTPEQIAAAGIKVHSPIGPLGAWFGKVFFSHAFGIGAVVAFLYFGIVGWCLTTGRRFHFWSLTFRCALLTVAVSIVVGLITYALDSPICWGGVHGHYVNKWLLTMTGVPGAIIVSAFLVGIVSAVYLNELRKLYIRWRKGMEAYRESRRLRRESEEKRRMERRARRAEAETATPAEEPAPEPKPEPVNQPQPEPQPEKDETIFVIDSPTTESPAPMKTEEKKPEPDLGFEIDVPVAETGKTTGSVAERLVAEQGEYDPRAELSRFKFPTLDLLEDHPIKATIDSEEQQANKDRIIKTLGNYGITVASIKATVGPTVTLYEIVPTEGIRISQIKRLEDDIALSLAAKGIRIIAPMPGKGTVGIEVPNREPQIVSMRTILASKKFRESKAALPVALGATISNEIFVTDLASMPHALVAGATGQGKSVGLNVLITSLLYRKHPTELKFVLVDPKMVEFSVYERLRGHYLASLPGEEDAIVTDPSKVLNSLNSLCVEMDNRYALLRNAAVNKIEDYNRKIRQRRLSLEKGHKYLPYIVVIIDEFADLIMTGGKEIEMPVMRITQKARAVGIHMIIATQRPSTNVLTGLIKANCPSRIAFRVLQNVDSRTILDRPGAEHLIGRGDMLYSQGGELERMQCAFISSSEVEQICDSIDAQTGFEEPYPLPEPTPDGTGGFGGGGVLPGGGMDRDPLFDEAARFITQSATASTSSLQRRFEIGYNRAGKIMDQMEAAGIVGPASGSKPRSVLVDPVSLERILSNR